LRRDPSAKNRLALSEDDPLLIVRTDRLNSASPG
jgi:hypothetical protein